MGFRQLISILIIGSLLSITNNAISQLSDNNNQNVEHKPSMAEKKDDKLKQKKPIRKNGFSFGAVFNAGLATGFGSFGNLSGFEVVPRWAWGWGLLVNYFLNNSLNIQTGFMSLDKGMGVIPQVAQYIDIPNIKVWQGVFQIPIQLRINMFKGLIVGGGVGLNFSRFGGLKVKNPPKISGSNSGPNPPPDDTDDYLRFFNMSILALLEYEFILGKKIKMGLIPGISMDYHLFYDFNFPVIANNKAFNFSTYMNIMWNP